MASVDAKAETVGSRMSSSEHRGRHLVLGGQLVQWFLRTPGRPPARAPPSPTPGSPREGPTSRAEHSDPRAPGRAPIARWGPPARLRPLGREGPGVDRRRARALASPTGPTRRSPRPSRRRRWARTRERGHRPPWRRAGPGGSAIARRPVPAWSGRTIARTPLHRPWHVASPTTQVADERFERLLAGAVTRGAPLRFDFGGARRVDHHADAGRQIVLDPVHQRGPAQVVEDPLRHSNT